MEYYEENLKQYPYENNRGIIWQITKRWNWLEDCQAEAALTYVQCLHQFDPTQGSDFISYLWVAIDRRMQSLARQQGKRKSKTVALAGDVPQKEPEPVAEPVNLAPLLSLLTPKEQNIMLRWANGETYQQIGESLGVSKQRIGQIVEIALNKMRGDDGA